jgi:hypothetical protein
MNYQSALAPLNIIRRNVNEKMIKIEQQIAQNDQYMKDNQNILNTDREQFAIQQKSLQEYYEKFTQWQKTYKSQSFTPQENTKILNNYFSNSYKSILLYDTILAINKIEIVDFSWNYIKELGKDKQNLQNELKRLNELHNKDLNLLKDKNLQLQIDNDKLQMIQANNDSNTQKLEQTIKSLNKKNTELIAKIDELNKINEDYKKFTEQNHVTQQSEELMDQLRGAVEANSDCNKKLKDAYMQINKLQNDKQLLITTLEQFNNQQFINNNQQSTKLTTKKHSDYTMGLIGISIIGAIIVVSVLVTYFIMKN